MRRIVAVWSSFAVAGVIVVAALAAPGSTQVVAKIDTGAGPCSEAGGFGSVWVGVGGAGLLARIDPATNGVTGSVDVGFGPCGVAIGAGSVWVDGYGTSSVIRVDPARMKVTKRIPMRDQIWDVTYGDASVWATEPNRAYVDRINPKTNKVGRRIRIPKSGPANLRYGGGAVWVGSLFGNRVFRIDARTNRVTSVRVGQKPRSVAVTSNGVWVSNNGSNTVGPRTQRSPRTEPSSCPTSARTRSRASTPPRTR
jgi:virginiamycin B lyase